MGKIRFFLTIALLCASPFGGWGAGAWAQTNVSNENELNNAISDGTTVSVKLTKDILLDQCLLIDGSKSVTIDLNGHDLGRGLSGPPSEGGDGHVIGVRAGSSVTINDGSSNKTGTISGGYAANGGGIYNNNGATVTVNGGTITSNYATTCGGAIYNKGELHFNGGTIKDCTSGDCGGIYNAEGGTLEITGGTIQNCTSERGGGGVVNYGTATISGGSISGNHATTRGGGVWNGSSATLTVSGGTITGNSAGTNGGGVFSYSSFSMSGSVNITGNENGNLYLDNTSVITVTGALTGSNIGVSLANGNYNRAFTSGYSTNNNANPSTFFSADLSGAELSLVDGEAKLSASGQLYVECRWEGGNTDGHVVKTTKLASSWSYYSDTEDLYAGWYVFSGSGTFNTRPRCHGDVKFILQDDCNVEFTKGIHIDKGKTLTIYAQSAGTGKLRATGDNGSSLQGDAAIGGNNGVMGGNLVIHGGDIYAYPTHDDAAGIGGGDDSNSGMQSLTIYGGTIEARGRSGGAGIGGGQKNNMTTITIYGGTVTAKSDKYGAGIGGGEYGKGGTMNIYGGTITATGGEYGAGIGGGDGGSSGNRGEGGTVKIYGGTITAKGGAYGAGIGGGRVSKGGTVEVRGGTVTATGGKKGAGIGSGGYGTDTGTSSCGTFTIYDGIVYATGTSGGAAIGGGYNSWGGTANFKGGTSYLSNGDSGFLVGDGAPTYDCSEIHIDSQMTVTVNGSRQSSGNRGSSLETHGSAVIEPCDHSGANYSIKDSGKHTLSCSYCGGSEGSHDTDGASNACSKCGYGGTGYTITFYEANEAGDAYAKTATAYTTGYQVTFNMPQCSSIPTRKAFVGWKKVTSDAPTGIDADDSELSSLTAAGSSFKVSESATYYARYQTDWEGSGSGTSSDPYQISNTSDWNYIATKVNSGYFNYSGKYFKLMNDISATTMIGEYNSSSKYFAGNFNGDGHTLTVTLDGSAQGLAPFGTISGGAIQNLHVAGTVSSSGKNVAGLVAVVNGDIDVRNCRVSTAISTSASDDVTSGGFVAYARKGNANYTRCVFDGSISASGTSGWGGFVGWTESNNSATSTFTNCLFMPESVAVGSGNTFARYRKSSSFTITNSYYTKTCGDAQGTLGYTVESGTDNMYLYYGEIAHNDEGEVQSELEQLHENDIYAFDTGLLYDGKFYTGATTEVTFTPVVTLAEKGAYNVKANDDALTASNDGSYTMTMNSQNVTVKATIDNLHYDALTLNDATANTATIAANREKTMNVTIDGRTLYKNGSWNTLCLPFDVSAAQISAYTDFSDCTIKELDTEGWYDGNNNRYTKNGENYVKDADASVIVPVEGATGFHQTGFDTGTLYLYFKTATKIEARKPYIIMWASGANITSPTFNVSYIESSSPGTIKSADGTISFIGCFDPVAIGETGDAKHYLYLGGDNNLYYPTVTDFKVNSFRAYFQLNGITAGEPNSGQPTVRAFSLHFGDDSEQTGIENVPCSMFHVQSNNAWYSLDGRRLSGNPSRAGVYIYNGIKVAIK